IIDVWMQHPTFPLSHEIFEPLRRWTGLEVPQRPVPVASTLAATDAGGVTHGILCVWQGPDGVLISNDEVARKYPDCYIDTSAYAANGYRAELVRSLKADARKKVMFGTTSPMIQPQRALAGLDALGSMPRPASFFSRATPAVSFDFERSLNPSRRSRW